MTTYYGYEIHHDPETDTWDACMDGWIITCDSLAEAKHEVRCHLGLETKAFDKEA